MGYNRHNLQFFAYEDAKTVFFATKSINVGLSREITRVSKILWVIFFQCTRMSYGSDKEVQLNRSRGGNDMFDGAQRLIKG